MILYLSIVSCEQVKTMEAKIFTQELLTAEPATPQMQGKITTIHVYLLFLSVQNSTVYMDIYQQLFGVETNAIIKLHIY